MEQIQQINPGQQKVVVFRSRNVNSRIRLCRLIERMEDYPEAAQAAGLHDSSFFQKQERRGSEC